MQKALKNALVIGSRGTIGRALRELLTSEFQVFEIHQANCDYSEKDLAAFAEKLEQEGGMQLIICCIGVLHGDDLSPEKRLAQIDAQRLSEYFRVNAVLPALCLKHFSPLLDKKSPSSYLSLSAMVGSISENELGGWYGYRSSKAALNMLVKTAAIEIGRSNKNASIVAIHPGTTQGPLSKPFSKRVSANKYYTPAQSAARIINVAKQLNPQVSGAFFNWDGRKIEW